MIQTGTKTANMIQIGDHVALKFCSTWLNEKNQLVEREYDNQPRICYAKEKAFVQESSQVIAKDFVTKENGKKVAVLTCADGNTYRFHADQSRIIVIK
jgi:hypothetical protein